jgi:ubiquinol-cytochrome c reductase cytochrome c subunit
MAGLPRRLLAHRLVLPAAVLLAVGLSSVLALSAGAGASGRTGSQGSHRSRATHLAVTAHRAHPGSAAATTSRRTHTAGNSGPVSTPGGTHFVNTKPTVTPSASACTQDAEKIGYKSPKDSGSPQNSTPSYRKCSNGKVVQYGNSSIVYKLPPDSSIAAGHRLFEENCSSCHLPTAQGSAAAPSLRGVGPATVNFWVTTGRMPAATPLQVQATIKPPRLTEKEANEVAAWINSLTPSAPYIPVVNVKKASLTQGASLFALNCAACHTITGAGDALAFGTKAPTLHIATSRQVAEAIRTGPGNMPRFTGNLSDAQVRDIVAYVTEKIEHPTNDGGFGLGGVGPVTEGFVALLLGVGGLMLICFWIGDRAK